MDNNENKRRRVIFEDPQDESKPLICSDPVTDITSYQDFQDESKPLACSDLATDITGYQEFQDESKPLIYADPEETYLHNVSSDDSFEGIVDEDEDIWDDALDLPTESSPPPTSGNSPIDRPSTSWACKIEEDVQVDTVSILPSPKPLCMPNSDSSSDSDDEEPASLPLPDRSILPQNIDDQDPGLRWKGVEEVDDYPNILPPFIPHRMPGPQLPGRGTPYNLLEIFLLFFPRDMVGKICDRMVEYVSVRRAKKEIKYRLPKEFGPDMFYAFLACLLFMGLVRLPETRDYWSGLFGQPFLKTSPLSGNEFHFILWALHCTTVEQDEDMKRKQKNKEPWDKLGKIRLVLEQIKESCREYMAPDKHLAVDERIVACKSKKISFRQFIKNKPTRTGIKLWVLADSKTGYTYDFDVYTGKEHAGKNGPIYSVVQNLMEPCMNCGHRVYMDNLYTSQALFEDFFAQKTLCVGTVQENRQGYPKNASNALNNKSARGEIRWCRQGPVCYFQWKDARVVSMASTMHSGNALASATRRVPTGTGVTELQEIPIPQCIRDYNMSMGGVDLSDQLIESYNCLRRTNKWYRKMFFHFVDVAELNSFLIYSASQNEVGMPKLSHKNGRMLLTTQLLSMLTRFKASPTTTSLTFTATQLLTHMPELRVVKGTCHLCKMLNPKNRTRTYNFCRGCNVAFCYLRERNCFAIYHDDYFEPQ